jgi:gliding motility-associated-like protein
LLLPDAFSPNRDQLNDALRPVGIALRDLTLRVWNRWGQLIYEGQGPQTAWNGQHNQQPVPTGLYLVRITATGNDGKPIEVVKQVWVK